MRDPQVRLISKREARKVAARAVIALLAERWPATFAVFEARRRPLKVGVHNDIIAALDGAVTAAELGSALRYYTHNPFYLDRLREGAARVGLDGKTAGEVTATQAADAAAMWAKAVARNRRKKTTEMAKPASGRLGLTDLKREALARKAATTLEVKTRVRSASSRSSHNASTTSPTSNGVSND